MSTALWMLLVIGVAAVSAVAGFRLARRGAPTRAELADLEQALETARGEAEQVQAKVSEHFEKSALLFGQLAQDYRAFLEHFSDSAQALGLPERRARELLEQGYQPLLTQQADPESGDTSAVEAAVDEAESGARAAATEETRGGAEAAEQTPGAAEATAAVRVVEVDLPAEAGAPAQPQEAAAAVATGTTESVAPGATESVAPRQPSASSGP